MEKIKNQLAILIVQEADIWNVCDKTDWPDSLRAIHNKHCKKVEAFKLDNFPKRVTISGCIKDEDEDTSHYDIDDALTAKFDREMVQPDSEGGMFCCYTDVNNSDEVAKYLKENWKTLNFEVEKEDEGASPFVNWSYAQKHVEENNLEVPAILDGTIMETLKEFDKKIEAAKAEKQEFINTLNTL